MSYFSRPGGVNDLHKCATIQATAEKKPGKIHVSMGFNPLTSMSDQDKISPHDIHTISSRQVMRIKRNIN